MPVTEHNRARLQFVALLALAAAWRLWLTGRYYGWEEGDYGNVMMVREVIDSRLTWFRTSHMPGWYVLSALIRLIWDAPRGSALLLTMSLSCANVALAALVARKLVSTSASWLLGLWLVFQPEMALYGASTLRSPVFASISFAGMAALLWGARDRGFGLIAGAFLIRMEGFFSLFLPALWSWARDAGRGLRSLLLPAAILGGTLAGWQLYITVAQGEGLFITSVFQINLAPDVHGGELPKFDVGAWLVQGIQSSWWLLTWTLPRKIGWTWWILAAGGGWAMWQGSSRPGGRTAVAFAAFGLAFWLGEGFVSHHEPNHNLYWVWLLHAVPFLGLLAAGGWGWLERRLPSPGLRAVAWAVVLISVVPSFMSETHYQASRASSWYRPQLELSTWLEEETPPGTGVLVSSIPEVWLKRQPSQLRVFSWWTLPEHVQEMDPNEFGAWLAEERIDYVVWFAEEWTDSARVAPWMVTGQNMTAGPVGLTAVDREDGYGWILYLVTQHGREQPPVPPPYGQGHRGRGWDGVR